MPEPRANETRRAWLQRCMADGESRADFPDADQRFAFCAARWDRSRESMSMAQASNRHRQIAERMTRELDRLEGRSRREVRSVSRRIRVDVLRAYREGGDIGRIIAESRQRLTDLLTDAMTAAHLTGQLRTIRQAAAARSRGVELASVYDEALRFLRRRMELTPEVLAELRAVYGPQAVEAVTNATRHVERKVQSAVAEAAAEGLAVDAGTARVRQSFEAAGVEARNPYVFEAVFRTQTALSYAAGRMHASRDRAIDEILWGYTYVTAGDDRVRPSHVALDGVTLPKDHPRWREITPPNGWSCRCMLVDVYKGEAEARLVDVPDKVIVDGMSVTPGADQGWGFSPADVIRDVVAV